MMTIQLFNGDCLEVMDKLIADGIKVDAVITDPPYGTTACKWDSIIPINEMWLRLKKLKKENTPTILFGKEPFSSNLRLSNLAEYKYDWIWVKNRGTNFLNCKKMPLFGYENVCVFYKKNPFYQPQMKTGKPYKCRQGKQTGAFGTNNNKKIYTVNCGERYPLNILNFKSQNGRNIHPTQKPVELLEYLIKTYTNVGDIVLDFTMGSGTTGVACKNLNRNFIGIELDKKYFDIAEKRINETTV